MILSNTEILQAITEGYLKIGDLKGNENPGEEPFNTSSIDLHLDSDLAEPEEIPAAFDLRKKGLPEYLRKNSKSFTITESLPRSLDPGQFLIGKTQEFVDFPLVPDKPRLAACVEGRSGVARCGILVHFTAPTIHAGFDGTITLEIKNLSPMSFLLFPGMRICQLIIEEVKGEIVLTPSQFRGQTTPTGG